MSQNRAAGLNSLSTGFLIALLLTRPQTFSAPWGTMTSFITEHAVMLLGTSGITCAGIAFAVVAHVTHGSSQTHQPLRKLTNEPH